MRSNLWSYKKESNRTEIKAPARRHAFPRMVVQGQSPSRHLACLDWWTGTGSKQQSAVWSCAGSPCYHTFPTPQNHPRPCWAHATRQSQTSTAGPFSSPWLRPDDSRPCVAPPQNVLVHCTVCAACPCARRLSQNLPHTSTPGPLAAAARS